MAERFKRISPFLWFDDKAEEAAKFYVGIFENSKIVGTTKFTGESAKMAKKPEGSVMTVDFELEGEKFAALNGGPMFKFNESISFVIRCKDQAEVDRFWDALTPGGDPKAQQCGWLKDKFGLSWQVIPDRFMELIQDPDAARAKRVMDAMMTMKKLDVPALEKAAEG
jgi:predicted 3-demethylubiquinone-9 3-methyltransferase (glyoxalase superfamily)